MHAFDPNKVFTHNSSQRYSAPQAPTAEELAAQAEKVARETIPSLFQLFPSIELKVERFSWLIGNRCLPSVIQSAFDNCTLYVHVSEDAVDGSGSDAGDGYAGDSDAGDGSRADGTGSDSDSNSSSGSSGGGNATLLDPFLYIVNGDIYGFSSRITSNPEYKDGTFVTKAHPYDPDVQSEVEAAGCYVDGRGVSDAEFLAAHEAAYKTTWEATATRNLKNNPETWNLNCVEHMTILYKQAVPGLIEDEPRRDDPTEPPPPPPVWSLQISTEATEDNGLRIVMPAHAVQQINLHTRFFFPWNYEDMDLTVVPAPNGQRLHTALEITADFENKTRNAFSVELPFANIEEYPVPAPDQKGIPTPAPSAVLVHAGKVRFRYTMPQIVGSDGYKAKFEMVCEDDVAVATAFTFGVVNVLESCQKLSVNLHMPVSRVFGKGVEWKCFVGIDNGVCHRNANQTALFQAFGKCLGQKPNQFSESDFTPIVYAIVAELRSTPVYFGANQHNLCILAAATCAEWFAGFGVNHRIKKRSKEKTEREHEELMKKAKQKREKAKAQMAAAAYVSLQGPLITIKANVGYTAYIAPFNVGSYTIDIGYTPPYRLWTAKEAVAWALRQDDKWQRIPGNTTMYHTMRSSPSQYDFLQSLSDTLYVNNIDGEMLAKVLSGEVEIPTLENFTPEILSDHNITLEDDELDDAVAGAAGESLNTTYVSTAPTGYGTPRKYAVRSANGGGDGNRSVSFADVVSAAVGGGSHTNSSGGGGGGGGGGSSGTGAGGSNEDVQNGGDSSDSTEMDDGGYAIPGLSLHLPAWHTVAFHERARDHRLHFDSLHVDIATRFYDSRFFDDSDEFLSQTNSILVGLRLQALTGCLSGVMIKYLQQWVANQFGAQTAMRTKDDTPDIRPKLRIHTLRPAEPAPPTSVGMTVDADDTKFGLMTRLYNEDRNGCEAATAGNHDPDTEGEDGVYPLSLMISSLHFGLVIDKNKMHVSANLHGTSLLTKETAEPAFAMSFLEIQKTWLDGDVEDFDTKKTYATRTAVVGGTVMASLSVKAMLRLEKFSKCLAYHLEDKDNKIVERNSDAFGDPSDKAQKENPGYLTMQYHIVDIRLNPITVSFTSHDERGRRGNIIQLNLNDGLRGARSTLAGRGCTQTLTVDAGTITVKQLIRSSSVDAYFVNKSASKGGSTTKAPPPPLSWYEAAAVSFPLQIHQCVQPPGPWFAKFAENQVRFLAVGDASTHRLPFIWNEPSPPVSDDFVHPGWTDCPNVFHNVANWDGEVAFRKNSNVPFCIGPFPSPRELHKFMLPNADQHSANDKGGGGPKPSASDHTSVVVDSASSVYMQDSLWASSSENDSSEDDSSGSSDGLADETDCVVYDCYCKICLKKREKNKRSSEALLRQAAIAAPKEQSELHRVYAVFDQIPELLVHVLKFGVDGKDQVPVKALDVLLASSDSDLPDSPVEDDESGSYDSHSDDDNRVERTESLPFPTSLDRQPRRMLTVGFPDDDADDVESNKSSHSSGAGPNAVGHQTLRSRRVAAEYTPHVQELQQRILLGHPFPKRIVASDIYANDTLDALLTEENLKQLESPSFHRDFKESYEDFYAQMAMERTAAAATTSNDEINHTDDLRTIIDAAKENTKPHRFNYNRQRGVNEDGYWLKMGDATEITRFKDGFRAKDGHGKTTFQLTLNGREVLKLGRFTMREQHGKALVEVLLALIRDTKVISVADDSACEDYFLLAKVEEENTKIMKSSFLYSSHCSCVSATDGRSSKGAPWPTCFIVNFEQNPVTLSSVNSDPAIKKSAKTKWVQLINERSGMVGMLNQYRLADYGMMADGYLGPTHKERIDRKHDNYLKEKAKRKILQVDSIVWDSSVAHGTPKPAHRSINASTAASRPVAYTQGVITAYVIDSEVPDGIFPELNPTGPKVCCAKEDDANGGSSDPPTASPGSAKPPSSTPYGMICDSQGSVQTILVCESAVKVNFTPHVLPATESFFDDLAVARSEDSLSQWIDRLSFGYAKYTPNSYANEEEKQDEVCQHNVPYEDDSSAYTNLTWLECPSIELVCVQEAEMKEYSLPNRNAPDARSAADKKQRTTASSVHAVDPLIEGVSTRVVPKAGNENADTLSGASLFLIHIPNPNVCISTKKHAPIPGVHRQVIDARAPHKSIHVSAGTVTTYLRRSANPKDRLHNVRASVLRENAPQSMEEKRTLTNLGEYDAYWGMFSEPAMRCTVEGLSLDVTSIPILQGGSVDSPPDEHSESPGVASAFEWFDQEQQHLGKWTSASVNLNLSKLVVNSNNNFPGVVAAATVAWTRSSKSSMHARPTNVSLTKAVFDRLSALSKKISNPSNSSSSNANDKHNGNVADSGGFDGDGNGKAKDDTPYSVQAEFEKTNPPRGLARPYDNRHENNCRLLFYMHHIQCMKEQKVGDEVVPPESLVQEQLKMPTTKKTGWDLVRHALFMAQVWAFLRSSQKAPVPTFVLPDWYGDTKRRKSGIEHSQAFVLQKLIQVVLPGVVRPVYTPELDYDHDDDQHGEQLHQRRFEYQPGAGLGVEPFEFECTTQKIELEANIYGDSMKPILTLKTNSAMHAKMNYAPFPEDNIDSDVNFFVDGNATVSSIHVDLYNSSVFYFRDTVETAFRANYLRDLIVEHAVTHRVRIPQRMAFKTDKSGNIHKQSFFLRPHIAKAKSALLSQEGDSVLGDLIAIFRRRSDHAKKAFFVQKTKPQRQRKPMAQRHSVASFASRLESDRRNNSRVHGYGGFQNFNDSFNNHSPNKVRTRRGSLSSGLSNSILKRANSQTSFANKATTGFSKRRQSRGGSGALGDAVGGTRDGKEGSIQPEDDFLKVIFEDEQKPITYWSDLFLVLSEIKVIAHFDNGEEVRFLCTDVGCSARVSDRGEMDDTAQQLSFLDRQHSATSADNAPHFVLHRRIWYRQVSVMFTANTVSLSAVTRAAGAPQPPQRDASSAAEVECEEGCGWTRFEPHTHCCTHCRDGIGHAFDCGRKNSKINTLAAVSARRARSQTSNDTGGAATTPIKKPSRSASTASAAAPAPASGGDGLEESLSVSITSICTNISLQKNPDVNNFACSVHDVQLVLKDSPTRCDSLIEQWSQEFDDTKWKAHFERKGATKKKHKTIRPAYEDSSTPFIVNARLRKAKFEVFPLPSLKMSYAIPEVVDVWTRDDGTRTSIVRHGLWLDAYRIERKLFRESRVKQRARHLGGLESILQSHHRSAPLGDGYNGHALHANDGSTSSATAGHGVAQDTFDELLPITRTSSTITVRVNLRDHRLELSSKHLSAGDQRFNFAVDRIIHLPAIAALDIDSTAHGSKTRQRFTGSLYDENETIAKDEKYNRVVAVLVAEVKEQLSMDAMSQLIGAHETLMEEVRDLTLLVEKYGAIAKDKRAQMRANSSSTRHRNSTKLDILFRGAKIAVGNALTTRKRQHGYKIEGGDINVLAFYTGNIHVSVDTLVDLRHDTKTKKTNVLCPPEGMEGPGLYFGKVDPDYERKSLEENIEVIKFYFSLCLNSEEFEPFDLKKSKEGARREFNLTISEPTLVIPWQTISVAWSFSLDFERARSQWRRYQRETDSDVKKAAAEIRKKINARVKSLRSNSEEGSFEGLFKIYNGQARFICMPRTAALRNARKGQELDILVVNFDETGVDLSAKEGLTAGNGAGKGEFTQLSACIVRVDPEVARLDRRITRSNWADGSVSVMTGGSPCNNRLSVPAGSLTIHKKYEEYDAAAREFTLKTGLNRFSLSGRLGHEPQKDAPPHTRNTPGVSPSGSRVQQTAKTNASVSIDIQSSLGAHLCVLTQTVRRVSESIAVNTNLANIANSVEVDEVMEELQTQNFILEFLERNGATAMSISYARQHARVLEQQLQRSMLRAAKRRTSIVDDGGSTLGAGAAGGGAGIGDTGTIGKERSESTASDEDGANANVGQNYALSLSLMITRSELNMHFPEDVVDEGRLTKSNLQGRRLSNFADNIQRAYSHRGDELGNEEAQFGGNGGNFAGGTYSPRSHLDGGGGAGSNASFTGGGTGKHRQQRNVETIPFPELTLVGSATPPAVTENESSTNHRKWSAAIGIRMPKVTISPRVLDIIENTVKEYNIILELGRAHSVYGSSLLTKHVAAVSEAEERQAGNQNEGYDLSSQIKPWTMVVLVDISACEFLLKGNSGVKSEGYMKTPATKILVSSTHAAGSTTNTVQNITASFGELNIRVAEKSGRHSTRSPASMSTDGPRGAPTAGAKPALQATLAGFKLHITRVIPSARLHQKRGQSQRTTKITCIASLEKVLVMLDLNNYSLIRGFQDSWYDKERFLHWWISKEDDTSSAGEESDYDESVSVSDRHGTVTSSNYGSNRGRRQKSGGSRSPSMAFLEDSSDDSSDEDNNGRGSSKISKSVSSKSNSNSRTGTLDSGRSHTYSSSARRTHATKSSRSGSTGSKESGRSGRLYDNHEHSESTNIIVFIVSVEDVIATSHIDLFLGTTSASAHKLVARGQVHVAGEKRGTTAVTLETFRVGDANETTDGLTIVRHELAEGSTDPNGMIQGELLVKRMRAGVVYSAPKDGIASIVGTTPVMRASTTIDEVSAIIKSCTGMRHTVVLHLTVTDANAHIVDEWIIPTAGNAAAGESDVFSARRDDSETDRGGGAELPSSRTLLTDSRLSSSTNINTGTVVAMLTFQSVPTLKTISDRLIGAFKSSTAESTHIGASGIDFDVDGGGEDDGDDVSWEEDSHPPSSTYSEAFARLGKGVGRVKVQGEALTIVGFEKDFLESSWWLFNVAGFGFDFAYSPRSQVQYLDMHIGPTDDNSDRKPGVELYSMVAHDSRVETPRLAFDKSVEELREWCSDRKAACVLSKDGTHAKPDILVRARRSVLKSTVDVSQLKTSTMLEKIVQCTFATEFPDRIQVTLNAQKLNDLKLYVESMLQRTSAGGSAQTTPTRPVAQIPITYLLDETSGDTAFVFNPSLQPFSVGKDGKITVEWILAQLGVTDVKRAILGSIYKTLHVPLAMYVNKVEVGLHSFDYDAIDEVTDLKRETSFHVPLKQVIRSSNVEGWGESRSHRPSPPVDQRPAPRRVTATSPLVSRRFMSSSGSVTIKERTPTAIQSSADRPQEMQSDGPPIAMHNRPVSAKSGMTDESGGSPIRYFTPTGSVGSLDLTISPQPRSSSGGSPLLARRAGSSLRFEERVIPVYKGNDGV